MSMRLTVMLFSKMGAMRSLNSVEITDINMVSPTVRQFIPDIYTHGVWAGELDDIRRKDDNGWYKATHNHKTGDRAVILFYKGK